MLLLLASLGVFAAVSPVSAAASDDLVAKLLAAASQAARFTALKPQDFIFDFNKSPRLEGQGGFLTAMSLESFPALATGSGAMAIGVLGPCGLSAPHTHPGATEMNLILEEGPVDTALIMEDGTTVVQNNLNAGQATIFPQGSMHYQQNLGCKTAKFIASFNNADFGSATTSTDLQGLFSTPNGAGVLSATFGVEVQVLQSLMIPAGVVLGAQECLTRCGLPNDFNFTSTFKDYAIFSNSTWEGAPTSGSSSAWVSPSSSGSSSPSRTVSFSSTARSTASFSSTARTTPGSAAANAAFLADGSIDIPFSQNPLRSAVIGLGVTAGALLAAVIALLAIMARRRSGRKISPSSQPYRDVSSRSLPYATPYDDAEALTSRHSMDKV